MACRKAMGQPAKLRMTLLPPATAATCSSCSNSPEAGHTLLA